MGHTLPCICQASMGNAMGRNWHRRCQGWGRVLPCACAPSLLRSPARIVARLSRAEVVFCGRGAPLGRGAKHPQFGPSVCGALLPGCLSSIAAGVRWRTVTAVPKHCGTLVASLWLRGHSRLGSRFFRAARQCKLVVVHGRCCLCLWYVLSWHACVLGCLQVKGPWSTLCGRIPLPEHRCVGRVSLQAHFKCTRGDAVGC